MVIILGFSFDSLLTDKKTNFLCFIKHFMGDPPTSCPELLTEEAIRYLRLETVGIKDQDRIFREDIDPSFLFFRLFKVS